MTVITFPPGPVRKIPGSFFIRLQRDPLGFMTRLAQDYGDIAHFQIGPQHFYLLNHPDYIRDVLVTHDRMFIKGRALDRSKRLLGEGLLTSEGEFHLRQRRMIQPVFHRGRVASYGTMMSNYGQKITESWTDKGKLDIHKEMMRLTLMIVGETLFGTDVEGEAQEIGEALTSLVEAFNVLILPLTEFLEKLPLPGIKRPQRAIDRWTKRFIALSLNAEHP